MIALISPAKTMRQHPTSITHSNELSTPRFLEHTTHIAELMSAYNSDELTEIFRISAPLARELKTRFQALHSSEVMAAVDGYNGVVYKHFNDTIDGEYLQRHLRISSLLYGLLRPFDAIHPYRMEGFVRLAGSDERVDRSWRDIQTQTLIDDVNRVGGTLLYLASREERQAFHWRKVDAAVRVIDFEFLQLKGDRLRQVIVYTKMARGEMVRYMMQHQINQPDDLKVFEWNGYEFRPDLSTDSTWRWVMG